MRKTKFNIQGYSAFAACFLLVHEKAKAEAVYTDISDTLISYNNETFDIDMDGDDITDFTVIRRSFSFLNTTYYSGYVTSHLSAISVGPQAAGNKIAAFTEIWGGSAAGSFTMYFPYALAEGEIINDSLNFQDNGFQVLAFRYTTDEGAYFPKGGSWYPEVLDHYLGVYFKDTANCFHYGWIRCDVKNEGKELVVKDFAFESKCDVGILAGDVIGDTTTVDINEINSLNAIVYSFDNIVYVNCIELNEKTEVFVYALSGELLHTETLCNPSSTIVFKHTPGIYIVSIFSNEKKYSKKVFLH